MTTLILPPALRARIASEARAVFPRECCGLIEGNRTATAIHSIALHPARNLSHDADRFEIDPQDHFAALRAARANGREIVGCYHSHPNGKAEPSQRDAEGAAEQDFVWLVAAVEAGAGAGLGAYVFDGTAFLAISLAEPASLDPAQAPRV